MNQNLLKKIGRIAGLTGMAVGAAIVTYALVFPISPTPKSLADFKAWEAQQTRQGGRGTAQTDQVTP